MQRTARISQLWVHPVKSCAAVAVDAVRCGPRGFDGDRAFLVVDAHGDFLTQRQEPKLATIRPERRDGHLSLRTGRGSDLLVDLACVPSAPTRSVTVWGDEVAARDLGDEAAAFLDETLGHRGLRLVAFDEDVDRPAGRSAPPGTTVRFTDAYPLLVVSEASLEAAEAAHPTLRDSRRTRPNLVVDGLSAFEEDDIVALASPELRIEGVKPCTRCTILDVDPDAGISEKGPLAALTKIRRSGSSVIFGQNAIVRGSGILRVGDELEIVRA